MRRVLSKPCSFPSAQQHPLSLQIALVHVLRPQFLCREFRAGDERFELGPDELRMDPAAEAAIRAGNDVLASRNPGEIEDAVGNDLGMLDDVGGVADNTRN